MSDFPFVSAYYFRAHMYTQVPRQVREDMEWMADHGTRAVVAGILEQDLTAAVQNVERIAAEAERVGMEFWITPSRWGNLVAGCPKVPCMHTALHPETVALREDGSPWFGAFGPYTSVHHPAVHDFFADSLEKALGLWPVSGVLWDECKALYVVDHSPRAKASLGASHADPSAHLAAQAGFFGKVNATALAVQPNLKTGLFIYGHSVPEHIEACARIDPLGMFGCDGRPWHERDGGMDDNGSGGAPSKFLLDQGENFLGAARAHGKDAYALIENHAIPSHCHRLLQRRLPEVFAQGWDHVTYYYYPRSCDEPEEAMRILGGALRGLPF